MSKAGELDESEKRRVIRSRLERSLGELEALIEGLKSLYGKWADVATMTFIVDALADDRQKAEGEG